MKYIPYFLTLLFITACGSSIPTKEVVEVKVSDRCFQYGEKAMGSVAVKWAQRSSMPDDGEGWRLIGLASHKNLSELGFTVDEIKSYAKEIYFTDFMSDMERDAISFRYYMRFACDLKEKGISALDISVVKEKIGNCWRSGSNSTEQCISRVMYENTNTL